jgi:hypothetical protein
MIHFINIVSSGPKSAEVFLPFTCEAYENIQRAELFNCLYSKFSCRVFQIKVGYISVVWWWGGGEELTLGQQR